ncbi:MAG: HlyD family secretion protein [Desulfovibrionaceae bacterium]|nr:HlyD family secretion protein [Desulfovibrionaceae bacterium]MBF0513287.1 HlyD family secretion protein [Desulfovibrionaceae bacterium]
MKEDKARKLPAPGRKRSGAPVALIALLAVLAACGAGLWWWRSQGYESTDDAFIAGHVASVSPRVAGRVVETPVDDNQSVPAGGVLVRLDPDTFKVKCNQAEADVSEAEQKLQEARARHLAALASAEQSKADAVAIEAGAANAATDLFRYNHLIDSGAVSQQARDNADTASRTTAATLQAARKRQAAAEAQAAVAAAQVKTAEAGVDKFRAALEQARLELSYTEVKASVAGRVTNKAVEPGDYLQPGQAVMSLVRDDVWVVANFKETQLTRMRPGQSVAIGVDAFPDHEFTGRVESLQAGTGAAFSLLPPQNASGNYVKVVQRVPVKIVFDQPPGEDYHLAPGMSVVPRVRVR